MLPSVDAISVVATQRPFQHIWDGLKMVINHEPVSEYVAVATRATDSEQSNGNLAAAASQSSLCLRTVNLIPSLFAQTPASAQSRLLPVYVDLCNDAQWNIHQ